MLFSEYITIFADAVGGLTQKTKHTMRCKPSTNTKLTLFIVLLQVGLMSGTPVDLTLTQGMSFFAACIPTAIGGWLSAKFQGRVAAASVGIVAKHPEAATKGLIFCGIVEFYAILSLVATIMLATNIL